MGFNLDTQATRSSLTSVDTTLAANIDATQDYIPVASTANFSTSVVAEIETTNEVVSFDSITWNKLWNSQFNVSYWNNTNTTITTGQSAPDGSNDAIKVTDDGAGVLFLANAVGSGVNQDSNYIRSIYAKVSPADSGDTANLLGHNSVSSIFTLTDQWQRIQYRAPSTAFATYFYGVDFRGATATATEIFIWAPQSELSANPANPYVPTFGTSESAGGVKALTTVTRGVNGTTAASATSGDSIQQLPFAAQGLLSPVSTTLSANINATQNYVPLTSTNGFTDYLNATINSNEVVSFGTISENLFPYSQELDNAYWGKARSTVTADQGVAPDGTTTADLITQTTNTSMGAIYKNGYSPLTNGAVYTYSAFAKYVTGSDIKFIVMQDYDITSGGALNKTWFNIETGAIGTNDSDHTATTTDVGNGWFRFTVTITAGNTGGNFAFYRSNADGGTTATLNDTYLMWGLQLDKASAATTYLPTSSTALAGLTTVTRGVNGTTAQAATSGDTVTQTPLSTGTLDLPLRLKGLSVSSDGAGAGRFTLCDKVGDTICDVDIPNTKIFDLDFGGGIVFPNGIFISNSDNITAYTLYTDPYNTPNLTAGG
jgi:hypothetical protein